MTALDRYIAMCAQAAQQLGIQAVVLAAQDPATAELRVVTSPGNTSDVLRAPLAVKLGLVEPGADFDGSELAWPGA